MIYCKIIDYLNDIMKKIAIIGLSLLLSACASESYNTNIQSQSYREDYATSHINKPMDTAAADKTSSFQEKNVPTSDAQASDAGQKKAHAVGNFGYTIQVVAVGSEVKANQFVAQLPQRQQPIWENNKVVNGTKWFTILYGDYASKPEAKQAIATLPEHFQQLRPFVKSIDSIKRSAYPDLKKLN